MLDDFPKFRDIIGIVDVLTTTHTYLRDERTIGIEDVGMTEDEFVAHRITDVCKVKLSFFFAEHGIEEDLFEDVTALLLDFIGVTLDEGFAEFINLFDRVLADGFVGLLGVPRTILAKRLHYTEGAGEGCKFLVEVGDGVMLFHLF